MKSFSFIIFFLVINRSYSEINSCINLAVLRYRSSVWLLGLQTSTWSTSTGTNSPTPRSIGGKYQYIRNKWVFTDLKYGFLSVPSSGVPNESFRGKAVPERFMLWSHQHQKMVRVSMFQRHTLPLNVFAISLFVAAIFPFVNKPCHFSDT